MQSLVDAEQDGRRATSAGRYCVGIWVAVWLRWTETGLRLLCAKVGDRRAYDESNPFSTSHETTTEAA